MKRYRTGDLALKSINLDVPDGQVMALIGPSGAGKSTAIRCINRLVEPTGGTVILNGTEITALGSRELRRARRRMGMIFQEYALVERLTVMENVLSGRLGYVGFWQSFVRKFPRSDVDEAFQLLARVGLDHMADKRADELSGGERQRVGICSKSFAGNASFQPSSTSMTSCWRRCSPSGSLVCSSVISFMTGCQRVFRQRS